MGATPGVSHEVLLLTTIIERSNCAPVFDYWATFRPNWEAFLSCCVSSDSCGPLTICIGCSLFLFLIAAIVLWETKRNMIGHKNWLPYSEYCFSPPYCPIYFLALNYILPILFCHFWEAESLNRQQYPMFFPQYSGSKVVLGIFLPRIIPPSTAWWCMTMFLL